MAPVGAPATTALVTAMAEAARWTPSVHNTQPWRLRPLPDGLRVLVDEQRALPVLDPQGRLRTVSCGAAVANAQVAATALGSVTDVHVLPEGAHGLAVADVVVVGERSPGPHDRRLADAVTTRRTHRRHHARDGVEPEVADHLVAVAERSGARLAVLDAAGRRHLARLLVRAAREQEQDARLLHETRSWLRLPADRHDEGPVDGVLLRSLGTAPYPVDSLVHGPQHTSGVPGDHVQETLARTTAVVLTTPGDTHRDHVVAGIALQRVLLEATVLDVVATWADQATQQASTRDDVSVLAGLPGHAQLVLRLGRPLVDVRVPPRRPLADLIQEERP